MVNFKKREYYDVITGDPVNGKNYGIDAYIFKKVDNIDMVFDSRGNYLGILTCKGKIIDGKFTGKKGPRDFKSSDDLKIWAGIECVNLNNSGGKILMTIEEDKN